MSDNEELKFVTVGTNKGFTAETNIDKAGNDLAYGNNFSLDGKNRVERGFINTTGAASGTYHLEFNVFDANDNKGITKRVNFVYQNIQNENTYEETYFANSLNFITYYF